MTGKNRALYPKIIALLWFPLLFLYGELIVKFTCFGLSVDGLGYITLFSLAAGLVCTLFCHLWGSRGNRVCSIVLTALPTVWFLIQTVYYTIFKTFLTVFSLSGAGGVLQFWRDILVGIGAAWLPITLLLLPLVVLCLGGKRYTPQRRGEVRVLAGIGGGAMLCQLAAVVTVNLSVAGALSPKMLYNDSFIPATSVATFGAVTTLRLDVEELLFPQEAVFSDSPLSTFAPPPKATPAPLVSAAPAPVVYGDNVLEIDFAALAESGQGKTLTAMHRYFGQVTPTAKNSYTGQFAGKNVILITAEGFSRFAVDQELTPTLYKLVNTGFVFSDFYNPLWWVSTLDGEYVATTSLIPKPGVWSMFRSGENNMYFTLGNQLRRQGYDTRAFHNHTYSYYKRNISHPNLGYDYKGVGNGLEVKQTWPESDLEMVELTLPDYVGKAPFHIYYMTVSGHLNYNFMGNSMSAKHKDAVSHLEMSEGPRAYMACQMELDLALEELLRGLEAGGQLENTVIALSADHYPYGMPQNELEELNGGPLDMGFDVYRSNLILWSGDMTEPVAVDKPCSSLDILPTLSNLLGLPYDSRLLMGRDIFSDSPPLVILSDRSFITDLGRYSSKTGVFTPNPGVTVPDGYVEAVIAQVSDKFLYSKLVLEQDYYNQLGLK